MGFDFTGTRNFDERTGYRSQSFLTVPMKNHEGEIIGVLQLINAHMPTHDVVVPFSEADQRLAESLASQAAIEALQPTGNPFLDMCLWKGMFPSRTRAFSMNAASPARNHSSISSTCGRPATSGWMVKANTA